MSMQIVCGTGIITYSFSLDLVIYSKRASCYKNSFYTEMYVKTVWRETLTVESAEYKYFQIMKKYPVKEGPQWYAVDNNRVSPTCLYM